MTYFKELEKQRHANPGLRFLTIYDRKIRMQVFELMCEDRVTYDYYSWTLFVVLRDYKHLLQEARSECAVPAVDVSGASSSAAVVVNVPGAQQQTNQGKQKFVDQHGNNVSSKRAKQILAGAGNQAPPLVVQVPDAGAAGGRAKLTPPKAGGATRTKMPDKEWKALQKAVKDNKATSICLYWNSTSGCSNPKCGRKHDICLECGGNHRWVDVHYRG